MQNPFFPGFQKENLYFENYNELVLCDMKLPAKQILSLDLFLDLFSTAAAFTSALFILKSDWFTFLF